MIFRQYIKKKRHKYGVKFFELCTYGGLVLNVEVYSGTKFQDAEGLGQTGAVVLHLMQSYFDKGYHLFIDNWYNSVSLTEYFSQRKTYITGTLRRDRKRNPQEVINKKLLKGEMFFQSLGDVSVTKWKDKRDVQVISNALVPAMVKTTNRHGKEKDKPNVVKIYNENMSGIDRSDQMLSYHSGLRKTIRWYKKVGIHLMEVMLSNAYYMYASVTPCRNVKNIKDFREVVVESLIVPPRKKRLMRPQLNFHCLSAIPATEKKKTPTRRCQHCRKRTEKSLGTNV